jgi:protein TonB
MQLGAIRQQVVEVPGSFDAIAVAGADAGSGVAGVWTPSAPHLNRSEVLALVLFSVALHGVLAYRLAHASASTSSVHEQQVVIEMIAPPPLPPVAQPPAVQPEKAAPVARKTEVHRPEPRTVAKLEPLVPRQTSAPTNELPALPVGDEPSLAMASGTGRGAITAPPPPPLVKAAPPVAAHEGANYLKNPRPAYPEIALRRGWEGQVLLRVRVSPEGRPTTISIVNSSGRDVLDQAATEAVRGWSFVPARQGSEAVAGWVSVPIVFHLQ